jgi:type VII secretion-associated serine protease mycosin
VAAAAGIAVLLVPAPARARAAACQAAPPPGKPIKAMPYEDQLYDLARLASLATGAGIRVAVIDSGVDDSNPQLRGRVAKGRDFLRNDSDGRQDCIGHGTGVASIIAAAPVDGVAFHGLAPDATIVPVRVSEALDIGNGKERGDEGSPGGLAKAITWAAGAGHVQVINLSLSTTADTPEVRRAVAGAVASGVVVVAAAGNHATDGNWTPYPAANDDVIGVGATDAGGLRASYSQHGDYVDLTAVGDKVTMAAVGPGQTVESGTSFAAPYVAATAALVLQRFPGLTPAQVQRRLIATADPAPGGRRSDEYGYGLLNPYRALTETLSPERAAPPVPAVLHTEDPAVLALQARRAHARTMSLVVAAVGAGVVVLVGILAVVVRRGRRRGWRPAAPVQTRS